MNDTLSVNTMTVPPEKEQTICSITSHLARSISTKIVIHKLSDSVQDLLESPFLDIKEAQSQTLLTRHPQKDLEQPSHLAIPMAMQLSSAVHT